MGTFTCRVGKEGNNRLSAAMAGETKAVVAAELRHKGLTIIAATLEGAANNQVCAVVGPGQESTWRQTLDADIVDLIKRRRLSRDQGLRRGPTAD
jgi:hypothetical protein